GAMQGITDAGHNLVPRGRKARAILGYLCFSRGKPIARTKLATLLWDDVPESQARASFRQALSELTSAWDAVKELVEVTRETIRLNVDSCWIDVLAVSDSNKESFLEMDRGLLQNFSGR